jgi:arabinogalactan endo-1,4-beta-galactosidase
MEENSIRKGGITRRHILGLFGAAALGINFVNTAAAVPVRKLTNGIDISWLPEVEAAGGKFFTRTRKKIAPLPLMRSANLKVGRLRVWVDPSGANGSLARALKLAKRLKANGMQICVDFHFSDTWADPGNQSIPSAWSSTSLEDLSTQVHDYVVETLGEFVRAGCTPQWVQLGNEISNGTLWPLGQINSNDDDQWTRLATLHASATEAMRSVTPKAKSILHLDCGGDYYKVKWWLEKADQYAIKYDVVGLSFYPQWHGTLGDLNKVLKHVAVTRQKRVVIAETAYPWINQTFGNDVINVAHPSLSGCPYTPSGQWSYVRKLQTMLLALPNNRGIGIWWWEGLSVGVVRNSTVTWNGGMTNSTLVDSAGTALPALLALGQK